MTSLLLHAVTHAPSGSAGSPLYRVMPEHLPGLLAVALVPVALWFLRRRANAGRARASRLVAGYRQLPAHERFLVWMLLVTAAVHLGLVFGDAHGPLLLLFALQAAAVLVVTRRLVLGRRWRLPAALLLSGSIVAYLVAVVASEPPDQVGMATKLVELAALGVVLSPRRATRLRRLSASTATVSLVVVTGLAAWIGAFVAAAGGSGDHHHGATPMPGTVMAAMEEREPTPAERAAANRFYRKAVRTLAKYRDTDVAARDGYQVSGLTGTDFHAANPTFAADGRVFDAARPETLVYASTSRGPVLLGALYDMPAIGKRGPAIGGPLTQWHAHENVCFSLAPPALTGLVSPFGVCPVGSIAIPLTPEQIHLWVVPGAPTKWGDLDPEWLASYLARFESRKTRGAGA